MAGQGQARSARLRENVLRRSESRYFRLARRRSRRLSDRRAAGSACRACVAAGRLRGARPLLRRLHARAATTGEDAMTSAFPLPEAGVRADARNYMPGFGNDFETEALPGA